MSEFLLFFSLVYSQEFKFGIKGGVNYNLIQIDNSSINLTISNLDYYVTPVDIASYNLTIDNIDSYNILNR